MKHSVSDQPQLDIMTVLRKQCDLSESALLSIQICGFETVREVVVKACNSGSISRVNLLFTPYTSAASTELRALLYDLCAERIRTEISISPLLIERVAIKTVDEIIYFIKTNFKKNSFASLLEYFKVEEYGMDGVMLYN